MDCVPFLNHIELYSINRKRRSNTMKNKENESYKIELCSEYIKSNNLGIKKQFKKHIVETGNKKFDEIGFLEKGRFKLFYTCNENLKIQRITNNIILDAIDNDKNVMSVSTYLNSTVTEYQNMIKHRSPKEKVLNWFDHKQLFICEYIETENIIDIIKKLEKEIDSLEIDVLYLPNLEFALIEYNINLQREALEFLNELALKKQISIVATLMPIIQPYQNGVFYFVNKIDEKSLETITSLTMGSKHNVVCTDNKTVIIKCQDYWNKSLDLAETVMMQSSDEFYTFDSITCYTNF